MTDRTDISRAAAKYDTAKVEAVMLEIVAELHPRHLTDDELSRQIVGDPGDSREIGTAVEAIRNLRESDLLHDRDDGVVEPTRAALHAVTLLAGRCGDHAPSPYSSCRFHHW